MARQAALTATQARRSGGFTLLELLLALAITALLVALVYAAYGVIARAERRSHAAAQHTEHMLAVYRWLRQQLEGARDLYRVEQGAVQIFFAGEPAGALWVVAMPRWGGSGLYVVRVGVQRHGDGVVDWVAQALPFAGARAPLDWSQATQVVLARGLTTLQWHYYDGVKAQWRQDWPPDLGAYPARVRVEVADAQGAWPTLVMALPRAR